MWNRSDELRFAKLSEELAVLEENRHRGLQRLRAVIEKLEGAGTLADATTAMIANAEELRDALEPFDSGIRAAPSLAPQGPQMPGYVPAPEGYERHTNGKVPPAGVLLGDNPLLELIDVNGVRAVYSALRAPWSTVVFWKLADGNK